MHYTIVKKGLKQWRLFARIVEGGLPVKLNDYTSRGAAYSTACLLLGRNRGSIEVIGAGHRQMCRPSYQPTTHT